MINDQNVAIMMQVIVSTAKQLNVSVMDVEAAMAALSRTTDTLPFSIFEKAQIAAARREGVRLADEAEAAEAAQQGVTGTVVGQA